MLIRTLALASVVSVALAVPASAQTGPRGAEEVIAEAMDLLTQELELVPQVNPRREGTPGYAERQAAYRRIEQAGTVTLAELRALGLEPSDAIVETLGVLPRSGTGEPPKPPTPERYGQALVDLRLLADAAASDGDRSFWPPDDVRLELVLAGMAILVLVGVAARSGPHRRRQDLLRQAMDDALTDPLTGTANRRCLDRDLGSYSLLDSARVAAMMIDIDHFKRFNDAHGHAVGDAVLRLVGSVLAQHVRADDVVYRYGGEEFCVLLPGAEEADAVEIAERIRVSVARLEVPGDLGPVTVSIGIAHGAASAVGSTVDHADRALYRAKHGGRNRTAVADALVL